MYRSPHPGQRRGVAALVVPLALAATAIPTIGPALGAEPVTTGYTFTAASYGTAAQAHLVGLRSARTAASGIGSPARCL